MKSRADYYREPGTGPGRGKPQPCSPALLSTLAAVRAARQRWPQQALSPRGADTTAAALAAECGVDRATVHRWITAVDRPAPRHQPAVRRWCARVLRAASALQAATGHAER